MPKAKTPKIDGPRPLMDRLDAALDGRAMRDLQLLVANGDNLAAKRVLRKQRFNDSEREQLFQELVTAFRGPPVSLEELPKDTWLTELERSRECVVRYAGKVEHASFWGQNFVMIGSGTNLVAIEHLAQVWAIRSSRSATCATAP